jgi:DNA-binding transcriptional ArsR family regulator
MMHTKEYRDVSIELATLLDALSHPARVQIIMHLAKYKNCPANNISSRLPLSKSTVSQHMSKLKKAELIICDPNGICNSYELNYEKLYLLKKYFSDLINEIDSWKDKQMECTDTKESVLI